MRILLLLGKWSHFLYAYISSIFFGFVNQGNLKVERAALNNTTSIKAGPVPVKNSSLNHLTVVNGDERIIDHDSRYSADATGGLPSTSSDVSEPGIIDPPTPSAVESSTSEVEFCPDCAAAVIVNEHASAVCSTSLDRGVITEVLKTLMKNIEPTPEVSEKPVAEKPCPKNPTLINLAFCPYKVIGDVAKKFGMKVTSHSKSWDVIWYSRPITESRCAKFLHNQRANYFPESQRALWKNNLALILTKMLTIFPQEYDFFPKSWGLPRDWHFMEKHARRHPKDWFIVKPNNWGCGYGIYLTNKVTKLSNCGKITSQVYIKKPFLIDDLKFDLRIYVLVTSCKPLRIFVYNEGLARFATEKYQEPDQQNKTNKYIHLTNYAVNKFSPTYVIDETKGTLRRWTTVIKWFNEHKIDANIVLTSMDDVIIKTLIAMIPTLKYHYFRSFPNQADSNSCFQIFGFDIMFGDDLKVYVLEVNGSPQFHADVTLDVEMTNSLIYDTFNILNLVDNPRDVYPLNRKNNLWSANQHASRLVTQRRIEWENSHLGNFRKIYPTEHYKHYKKFLKAADRFMYPL